MERIRILQVGVGSFGKSWVDIIKNSPEWELTGIEVEPIKTDREDRYLSLYEFYCALKENREPETGGKDNLYSLSMVFKSIESAKSGTPVSFRTL